MNVLPDAVIDNLTEMSTGSVVEYIRDWSDNYILIQKEKCQDGLFEYLQEYPYCIMQFVFKWKDHFFQVRTGSDIIKTEITITIIDPSFHSDHKYESSLEVCSLIEESRKIREKYR